MPISRREIAVRSAFIFMGVFTTTPVLAVLNPAQLESYGVIDPNSIVLTLLQHRGLLQFVLGAALVYAAFKPDIRVAVALASIFTKGGNLLLTYLRPEVFAEASTVAMVFDPLCIVLLVAILVDIGRRRGSSSETRLAGA